MSDKLRDLCEEASIVIEKLETEEFADLKSKLDFCVGSYDYDKNPAGLYEYGQKALEDFKAYKAKNPKKINKKLLAALEKALAE